MPTASLEFTLFMNTAGVAQGMGRARKEVAAGLRGLSQAAKDESKRIEDALASITAFRELKKGVADTKAEWVKAQAEATRLGAALNQVGPPTKAMVKDLEKAKKIAFEAQTKFQDQSVALNSLRTSMAAAGVSTIGLAATQAKLRAELAANEEKFKNQARAMQRTQDARNILNLPKVNTDRDILRLQAAYERLRVTGNLTNAELARAHVRMTEGIIALQNGTEGWAARLSLVREQLAKLAIASAGIGLAAKEAIAFESAMSNVRKVVDFQTPGEFKELTADIKNMSREIPTSLDGLAKIAEAGGQMGIVAKDIRGFTEVVAKMSTAFKITPDEAGEAVGRLMNIFKLTVPQTQRLGDAINHLGNNTNAVERDILNVMNRTGGMAKVFGLANTEAAALGSAFLALGRPPEIAATAINALMLTLQSAPTREADFKQALVRMGISAEKLAADIGKNPQQTLMTFLETLKSLDKQTQSETLITIFGRQYSDDIAILLSGLDTYKQTLDLVSKETNFAGSMQKEFNERVKTTESQMQLAKNAISEASVNLGSAFLPAIVAASKGIASLAHGVAELANRFPILSATAISSVTALAGFGALRLAWSLLRAQVVGMVAGMGSLVVAARALAFTPLGAMLTAAGAAAYVFAKATESSVQPLLENVSALGKSREATTGKIKTLEQLKNTLETTTPGTKEHTEAEEKLAVILPGANISLDQQGRVLAKVGDAASENAEKLKSYLDLLEKEDRQTLALQLDAQSRALIAGKEELESYTDGLRNWYGIGVGKAQTESQKFWLWLNKLTGTYDENIAKGAEMRRQFEESGAGLKSLLAEAVKAGISIGDLGQAMDGIHADPAAKEQIITLFRAITGEAGSTSEKVVTLAETFKQFSTAISGPVSAAKKGLVDAIGSADNQLGKYNEALSQHREKLKIAVDDETNSWKTLAKASEVAFESGTRELDDQYEKRRINYENDANAFRYYIRKETDTFIVEEKRKEDAKKFSQKSMIQTTNAMAIEESTAKIAETNRYLVQALSLSQREYQSKIDNAKRLKLDANRIDEERLQNQRSILAKVEVAYRQNIDKLIAEEKRHRDAAKQLAEERKSFNESISDRIQNIAEKGMDPVQVYASRQKRIVQEQIQAEEALQQGNYELARKHAEKMISLAEQTSDAVKIGDETVVGSKAAAARSIEQMQKAAQIENQAFREEAEAHAKAADSLKEKSATAEAALAKIRDAVQEVDAALAKDHTMIINANIEKIRTAGMEIDTLLEKKERVVQIKAELQGGATALESVVGDVLKGATSKAQASLDEVSRVFTKFKSEFSGWQPEVKATFDAVSATGSIDGLMAKFNEFKGTVPPEYKVAFLGNAGQAVAEIDGLIKRINEIPLERTVLINYVEKRSSSGDASQGFARGGFLPGWGSKDDVPALLQRGEFVIRKEAVRFYGLDRIQAMNQMRMKPSDIPRFAFGGLVQAMNSIRFKMPDIPRFEFGGIVRNLVIPTIPQVAFAGGGAVTPQVAEVVNLNLTINNRPEASLKGDRENVRRFVNSLQEIQRGMR